MEDLKDLDKQSMLSMVSVVDNYQNPYEEYLPDRRFKRQVVISIKLQMIVSRLCGFFDEVLVLEKIRSRNDVSPMFKNMLEYCYKSHLVLCCVVLHKVPEATKQQNVSHCKVNRRLIKKREANFVYYYCLRNGQTSSPRS